MTLSQKLARLIIEGRSTGDQVVEILSKYKMLSLLPSILASVKDFAKKQELQETIRIESPFPLNDESIKKIKRIVGNDLAPHEVTINKNLLAGFKARFKGNIYDASAERIIKEYIIN